MWNKRKVSQIKFLIEKGFDMIGEVKLLKEEKKLFEDFKSLKAGEGVISSAGQIRIKITNDSYLHFQEDRIVVANSAKDWPEGNFGRVKQFQLIAEEI